MPTTKKTLSRTLASNKITRTRQTRTHPIYNYCTATEFYPDKYITGLFEKRGNWNRIPVNQLKNTNKHIHFIYMNGKYILDKNYWGIKSDIGYIIDDERKRVSLKHNLIDFLSNHPIGRKYVMESHNLNMNRIKSTPSIINKYRKLFSKPTEGANKIYIFKPVSGYGGANIKMITSFEELKKHVSFIIKKWSRNWVDNKDFYKDWVLQEYLTDPLLYTNPSDGQKYKFHVRHYYIFRPGTDKSFYLNRGLFTTALQPYKQGYWHNPDIHDTHFHGRDGQRFPTDLYLPDSINHRISMQIHELYSIINKYMKKHAGCYDEYKHCFELFGADLIFTKNYNLKIIELNDSPGLAYENREEVQEEYKSIIENIMSVVVDKYFPPARKVNNPYLKDIAFLN